MHTKQKFITGLLALVLTFGFSFSPALAQDEVVEPEVAIEEVAEITPEVTEPGSIQSVVLSEVDESFEKDSLVTAGLQFMIRGKEALGWSLNIDETGFRTEAIQSSYNKVLTIVNSLFILGLLAIAVMAMFKVIIPRGAIRRTVFTYVIAVIFVNFALPINQLFIDGTNILQRTLLVNESNQISIADIVETPEYSDENTVGYSAANAEKEAADITLKLGADPITDVGEINTGLTTGFAGSDQLVINSSTQRLSLNSEISASLEKQATFDQSREHHVFAFVMMGLTGIAYLLLALIFVLRVVILWALMILSPVLFLLAIFNITRGYFYNWLSIYGKWLLIGPLAALGISVVVNIWQQVGLPLTSTYVTATNFAPAGNVGFMLPGSASLNTLSTTGQMMEYIVFLLMLYIPLFFAFALTRSKVLATVSAAAVDTGSRVIQSRTSTRTSGGSATAETKETETKEKKTSGFKSLLDSQIAKVSRTALPGSLTGGVTTSGLTAFETASSYLPEHLAVAKTDDLLSLAGAEEGSRHGKEGAITNLAAPQNVVDPTERKHVNAVRSELEKRASTGDPGAVLLMGEIQNKEAQISGGHSTNIGTASAASGNTPAPVTGLSSAPEIHVEATPVASGTNIIEKTTEKTVVEKAPQEVQVAEVKAADKKAEEDKTEEKEDNENTEDQNQEQKQEDNKEAEDDHGYDENENNQNQTNE